MSKGNFLVDQAKIIIAYNILKNIYNKGSELLQRFTTDSGTISETRVKRHLKEHPEIVENLVNIKNNPVQFGLPADVNTPLRIGRYFNEVPGRFVEINRHAPGIFSNTQLVKPVQESRTELLAQQQSLTPDAFGPERAQIDHQQRTLGISQQAQQQAMIGVSEPILRIPTSDVQSAQTSTVIQTTQTPSNPVKAETAPTTRKRIRIKRITPVNETISTTSTTNVTTPTTPTTRMTRNVIREILELYSRGNETQEEIEKIVSSNAPGFTVNQTTAPIINTSTIPITLPQNFSQSFTQAGMQDNAINQGKPDIPIRDSINTTVHDPSIDKHKKNVTTVPNTEQTILPAPLMKIQTISTKLATELSTDEQHLESGVARTLGISGGQDQTHNQRGTDVYQDRISEIANTDSNTTATESETIPIDNRLSVTTVTTSTTEDALLNEQILPVPNFEGMPKNEVDILLNSGTMEQRRQRHGIEVELIAFLTGRVNSIDIPKKVLVEAGRLIGTVTGGSLGGRAGASAGNLIHRAIRRGLGEETYMRYFGGPGSQFQLTSRQEIADELSSSEEQYLETLGILIDFRKSVLQKIQQGDTRYRVILERLDEVNNIRHSIDDELQNEELIKDDLEKAQSLMQLLGDNNVGGILDQLNLQSNILKQYPLKDIYQTSEPFIEHAEKIKSKQYEEQRQIESIIAENPDPESAHRQISDVISRSSRFRRLFRTPGKSVSMLTSPSIESVRNAISNYRRTSSGLLGAVGGAVAGGLVGYQRGQPITGALTGGIAGGVGAGIGNMLGITNNVASSAIGVFTGGASSISSIPIIPPATQQVIQQTEKLSKGTLRPKFIIPGVEILDKSRQSAQADFDLWTSFDYVQPTSEGASGNIVTNSLKQMVALENKIRFDKSGMQLDSIFNAELPYTKEEIVLLTLGPTLPELTLEPAHIDIYNNPYEIMPYDPSGVDVQAEIFSPYTSMTEVTQSNEGILKSWLYGRVP